MTYNKDVIYFLQLSWFPTQCGVSGEVQGFGKEEFTTFLKSVKAGRMLEKMFSIIMKKAVENVIRYDAASIQSLQVQPLLTFISQTFYLTYCPHPIVFWFLVFFLP